MTFALSKVLTMLTPSIGFRAMPLSIKGDDTPAVPWIGKHDIRRGRHFLYSHASPSALAQGNVTLKTVPALSALPPLVVVP